ncbi:MAG: penicillin-binding protein 2 [Lachnospiraceae bacterium]|jgi:stage V sporulation protein D (sporulation-specific penicillin-binding protein)|nr:penicillin-binding protein 2 [Lachnospiraceae bacterium]
MSKGNKKKNSRDMIRGRLRTIQLIVVLVFFALLFRIAYLNVAKGAEYTKKVLTVSKRTTIPARRGDIVDRNGTRLAVSELKYYIVLDLQNLCYEVNGTEEVNGVEKTVKNYPYVEPTKAALKKYFGIEPEVIDIVIKQAEKKKASDIEEARKQNENTTNITLNRGFDFSQDFSGGYLQELSAKEQEIISKAPKYITYDQMNKYKAYLKSVDALEKKKNEKSATGLFKYSDSERKKIDAEIKDVENTRGVIFNSSYARNYPYKTLASGILGYMSRTEEDSELKGSEGLEKEYQSELVGSDGQEYQQINGDYSKDKVIHPATDGSNVVSTIDVGAQSIVEKYVKKFNEEHKNEVRTGTGSKGTGVIVMDPRTGEIIAGTSYPNFDCNDYNDVSAYYTKAQQIAMNKVDLQFEDKTKAKSTANKKLKTDKADLKALKAEKNASNEAAIKTLEETIKLDETNLEDIQNQIYGMDRNRDGFADKGIALFKINMWRNMLVNFDYEPGSTEKPLTMAMGFESGKLKGTEKYYCGGYLQVGDHKIYCDNKDGHGWETVKEALQNSCNVALMQIGFQIGPNIMSKYQSIFGFGQYTGVDLPESNKGVLLSLDELRKDKASLATNSFGQNFNVTMIQMAAAQCSIINGGNYYKPHVVKEIQNSDGSIKKEITPTLVRKTVSEETSDILKNYMRNAVINGTGKAANIKNYAVGGKTGTAEMWTKHDSNVQERDKQSYVISFAGYAPQDNPEVLIYTVINQPNVGEQANSGLAVELSANIMKELFPYLGITKTKAANQQNKISSEPQVAEAER